MEIWKKIKGLFGHQTPRAAVKFQEHRDQVSRTLKEWAAPHREAANERKSLDQRRHEQDALEYYKQDREKRELRLERKSLKYLDQHHKRDRINKEGRNTTSERAMRMYRLKVGLIKKASNARLLTAEETQEVQRQADVLTTHLRLDHKPSEVTRLLEQAMGAELGDALLEEVEHLEKTDAEHYMPVIDEDDDDLGEEMVLTEEEAENYKSAALTPAERGGFSPTKAEYEGEMLPAYLRTKDTAPEVVERYKELRGAVDTFQAAVARRVQCGGVSKCAMAGPWVMGHEWWKRPGQPEWYCMECGESINTQFADLRDGKLWRLDGAFTRDVREALSKLGVGDAKFLGAGVLAQLPAVTIDNMADASRNLMARGKLAKMPGPVHDLLKQDVPGDLIIPLEHVGDVRGFLFKQNEDTLDLCTNCGCSKAVHQIEDVSGTGERTLAKLRHCPSLSKDPV